MIQRGYAVTIASQLGFCGTGVPSEVEEKKQIAT